MKLSISRHTGIIALTGILFGVVGVGLSYLGNPANSGLCISCFMENSAGALGLHANERMQYLRPELPGFILGALVAALLGREFRARGGNRAMPFFLSGFFLIVGSSVFVGCPIKLLLRLAAGDWTSLAGVAGLLAGVYLGSRGIRAGQGIVPAGMGNSFAAWFVPVLAILATLAIWLPPEFMASSVTGSAARRAPVLASFGLAALLGGLAQRSRFCITGALRDLVLLGRRSRLPLGLLLMVAAAFATNLVAGSFRSDFYGQPGAHQEYLWSFAGMALVGWLSVLIGGCPFRQMVKAGQGDLDSSMAVFGMLFAGGLVQSWNITASASGVPYYGKIAVLCGFFFLFLMNIFFRDRS